MEPSLADIYGYNVGGKTGTSENYEIIKNMNTFIWFSLNKPEYVLLVMLENQPAPNLIYDYRGVKTKLIEVKQVGILLYDSKKVDLF